MMRGALLPLNQWRGGTMPLCRKRLGIFLRRRMRQFATCSAQMKAQQSACSLVKDVELEKTSVEVNKMVEWMDERSEERG